MRYLLFVFLFLFLTTPALAQDGKTASRESTLKDRMNRIQENAQTRRGNIMEKQEIMAERKNEKEVFKQKLVMFKDKVKAERVSRISTILTTVNTNRTTAMLEHLEKMTSILTRLETHIATLEKEGKDTAAAKQAVVDAKTAIETAKQGVSDQANKEYTINISSESTVKTDALSTRETLHTDLQAVHETVSTARKATANAISVTQSILGDIVDGK